MSETRETGHHVSYNGETQQEEKNIIAVHFALEAERSGKELMPRTVSDGCEIISMI